MRKQEILDEIVKTEEHLANMKRMLAEREYERWKPQYTQEYYSINAIEEVTENIWRGSDIDKCKYDFYNCFQTREQAKAEAEKILVRRMLENIATRLNGDKVFSWNSYQCKYFIELCYGEKLSINTCTICKKQGTVYCLDERFLDIAIRQIGQERLKNYLRN